MPRPVNVSKSSINFLFLILEKTSLHNVFLAKSLMDTPKFSTTNYEKTQDKGGYLKGPFRSKENDIIAKLSFDFNLKGNSFFLTLII